MTEYLSLVIGAILVVIWGVSDASVKSAKGIEGPKESAVTG